LRRAKQSVEFGGALDNKEWSDNILRKVDPSFKHRWEVFDDAIRKYVTPETVWLDLGCGDNATIREFGPLAKQAIGVDIVRHEQLAGPFVLADIRHLPFADASVDLITLRFVVEHFAERQSYFDELHRVLKPGGRIILLTTNIASPFIFLPRIFLPYPLKHALITKIFKVADEDIFPTYHQANSRHALQTLQGFTAEHFEYISDLNYTRKWMFLVFLMWHILTASRPLFFLRTNIFAVLRRE